MQIEPTSFAGYEECRRLGLHFLQRAFQQRRAALRSSSWIGTLATLVAWLVGQAMQQFRAAAPLPGPNTTRHRPSTLDRSFSAYKVLRRQPVKLMLARHQAIDYRLTPRLPQAR